MEVKGAWKNYMEEEASHNPVDSQHEREVIGGQPDGLQNDGDGDDPSGWDARCSYAGCSGRHPAEEAERWLQHRAGHLGDLRARPPQVGLV